MSIDWQAFRLTLELAVIVSAALFVIGLPVAYWIAFSRWRWKFLMEAVVALPIVLPPTVLGFYVLVAVKFSITRDAVGAFADGFRQLGLPVASPGECAGWRRSRLSQPIRSNRIDWGWR